ncbi:MAG: amino acid ABC transporter permease [Clostridia bacterium]|nr:amino acid ABC transporter permease [Clostridia bacterium]
MQGFGNTLILTLAAAIIGLVLGFIVAVVKIAAGQFKFMKIPAAICNIYTTIIRGTPVALQLFLMVFSLFAIRGFKPYAVILTFGINSGAYISENIRAGILSTDKGQMEAGRALGLSWTKTMIKIIMPQAIKNIVPAIGNEMIALLKETAIVSMVGATVGTLTFDLNTASTTIYYSKSIGVSSYLSCAIVAGLLYLIVVYLMVWIVKLLERRFGRSERH